MTLNEVPSCRIMNPSWEFSINFKRVVRTWLSSDDTAKSSKKSVKQSLAQRIRQTVGIPDDSGSSSESDSSEGEAGSAGTAAAELRLRKDACSDGSMDRDATLRGKPALENDEDGDHSGGEAPEPDGTKRQFRLVGRKRKR